MFVDQERANHLMGIEKHRVDNTQWTYPGAGQQISIPLISPSDREEFILDVRRSQIAMKVTNQTRYQKTIILARLDLNGPPHKNPDGSIVPCPHVHLYREGYNDKWAYPLPEGLATDPTNLLQTLEEFMGYCHVTQTPVISPTMF